MMKFSFLLFSTVIFWFSIELRQACTAIGITPSATKSGHILLAHTDDAGGDTADVRLIGVERKSIEIIEELVPKRPVYHFNSGYPRLISSDRSKHYKPVSVYNDLPRIQAEMVPIGYIPDISPREIIEGKNIRQLDNSEISFNKRSESDRFRYAYFDQDYGMVNEVQLSIVESTCGARTVGWSKDLDYGYNLFGIAELTKVSLERCVTAKCAIKLMGELSEKYGFFSEDSGDPKAPLYEDSAESVIIGDRTGEVWVFHVLTGAHNSSAIWAAQRVPDGEITTIANGFIIREIDFSDKETFMYSSSIKETAVELGFWKKNDDIFDFSKVFGYTIDNSPVMPLYIGRRVWRVLDYFAPSLNLDSTLGTHSVVQTYPFSVKPDKLVDLTDVFNILKDHYEGTPYDTTKGLSAGPFGNPNRYSLNKATTKLKKGGWERPISVWRSLFSFVHQVDVNGNNGVLWYGPDKPQGTVYFPFAMSNVHVENVFSEGLESEFDTSSAWRAFNFLNNWAMLRYDAISSDIKTFQDNIQQRSFELNVLDAKELSEFRVESVKQWWSFAWKLVAKYSDGYRITSEEEGGLENLGYPDSWLEKTEYIDWPGDSYNPPKLVQNQYRKIEV